ncbi:MAG: FliA/WhiG family RNA polymerase sigma factor [Planctomycetota bacterium]|nr:FliA/WhiG family RNA polymerase sigma factor [Planctomycetota bacterium]MDR1520140.1 FliA/WhiG family RNA polymerase sigma factor [Planctomycetota bacterium]
MNDYLDDYTPPPPLGEREETELWRRYRKENDDEARCKLIENYMPLVIEMAERMAKKLPTFLDVQDLCSSGNFGLIDAVEKFDPDEGVKFSTYCNLRINGAIKDELRRQDWPSRQVRQKANTVRRTRDELENRLGRIPDDGEMAEYLGLDRKKYDDLLRDSQIKTMVSLDRKWDDNDDNEIGHIEMLPDAKAADPLAELSRAEIKEVALRGLSEDQKRVLTLYYYENLNLKEIGLALDLSESRVCQIHQQTLEFLKKKFIQRQITPFSL